MTPPGPACPPFSVTLVALKARSHASDSLADGVGVTIALSRRLTYTHCEVASTVNAPALTGGGAVTSSVAQAVAESAIARAIAVVRAGREERRRMGREWRGWRAWADVDAPPEERH